VTERFTDAGQAKPEAVAIAPTAEAAQVVATWTAPGVSLDVTSFQLVQTARSLPRAARHRRQEINKATKVRVSVRQSKKRVAR
jgi:hypothetical protein